MSWLPTTKWSNTPWDEIHNSPWDTLVHVFAHQPFLKNLIYLFYLLLFSRILFFSQELHWCGLLCYLHHCHPRLHRSGYRGWVWHIASDYITQRFMMTRKLARAQKWWYVVVWSGSGSANFSLIWFCQVVQSKISSWWNEWKGEKRLTVSLCLTIIWRSGPLHRMPWQLRRKQAEGFLFCFVWRIHNFMVAYSAKCLIVKSVGELRNASPPEKWATLLISGSFTTTCSLYGSLWMGDRISKAVLMFLSSFWLDDQWFPLALISFKFSLSHLVHWSATERPLCLKLTEAMEPCESPHQLCFSFSLTLYLFLFLPSSFKFSLLILLPISLLLFLPLIFFPLCHFSLPLSHINTYPVLSSTPDISFLPLSHTCMMHITN